MAGATAVSVISGLIGPASDEAISLVKEEFPLLHGLKEEISKLSRMLPAIEAALEDAEEKRLHNEAVQVWLQQLREVAYDVDDVLDEIETDAARMKAEGRTPARFIEWVRNCFFPLRYCFACFWSALPTPFIMARRVRAIRQRLGEIKEQQDLLGLNVARSKQITRPREAGRIISGDMEVVGRDRDKQKIIEKLLAPGNYDETESSFSSPQLKGGHDRVVLIPIVGMGGIGKTTLAQVVFNDEKVQQHFTLKKWLFVGENFDTCEIIKKITGEYLGNPTLDDLQKSLIDKLKDERFLIVLDDVWSEKWRQLWDPLTYNKRGSRVIVTTRNRKVVNVVPPIFLEQIQTLSDEDCWLIFKKYAFEDGNPNAHPELKVIGMEIVKKLKGVPLVARIVGSHLHNKDRKTWISILLSESGPLMQDENEGTVLPVLKLSYLHLPLHLKRCFAFCSVFCKDEKFDKKLLVHMWMAQRFVEPLGDKRMEEIGSDYFDDLLHRSFFQYSNDCYVMHDLVHDLAQAVSVGDCLRIEGNMSSRIPNDVRHLYIFDRDGEIELQNITKAKKVRTLIYEGLGNEMPSIFPQLLNQFKCLRVLALRRIPIKELPDSIWDLKHLRYLELFSLDIVQLPELLCTLYNLQTLLADDNLKLPTGMSKLVNLRYLQANEGCISRITGIGKLTSLQELTSFSVSRETGRKLDELKDMTQLRGKLHIRNIENVGGKEEASLAQLETKEHLQELVLSYDEDCDHDFDEDYDDYNEDDAKMDVRLQEEILEALRPPRNLRQLKIKGNCGTKLPPLGHLHFLKHLSIRNLSRIKQVGREFYSSGGGRDNYVIFPCLEELEFSNMPRLEEWVGIENKCRWFPSLRKLNIFNCPKLRELPAFPPSLTALILDKVGLRDVPGLMQGCDEDTGDIVMAESSSSISWGDASSSSLSTLYISKCHALSSLSSLLGHHELNSLQKLDIDDCEELVSLWQKRGTMGAEEVKSLGAGVGAAIRGGHLTSLQTLRIQDCPKLHISAEEMAAAFIHLTSLAELEIRGCPKALTSLPGEVVLHQLCKLNVLILDGCEELESLLGFETVLMDSSLTYLVIVGCPKLLITKTTMFPPLPLSSSPLPSSPPVRHLKCLTTDNEGLFAWILLNPRRYESLEKLVFHTCAAVTIFIEEEEEGWWHNFPSLTHIEIYGCPNLQSLPEGLHGLSSLKRLILQHCPQIQCLPKRGLPPSLEYLWIYGCPLLADQCRRPKNLEQRDPSPSPTTSGDSGSDWHKIAHVPMLEIREEAFFYDPSELTPEELQNAIGNSWKLADIVDSNQLKALKLPDSMVTAGKVLRLLYTNSGLAVLALTSTAVHKLWKWQHTERNSSGKSTVSAIPQLWQPLSGTLLINDTTDINEADESTACIALSKNDSYVISASGGKVSLFNIMTFKVMTTFMSPPPAATFLAFYPQDNNIIAIGMEDSSIQIYNVRTDEVKAELKGHLEKITGLAFSQSMNMLVSSGADAQLCVWNIDVWEKRKARFIQPPASWSAPLIGETKVQFHNDQTHFLVVHESQLAIYDGKLDCLHSWFPRDTLSAPISSATYSSDGLLVYAGFYNGTVGVFDAESMRLQCRIAHSAYIPHLPSGTVYPTAIAAHPSQPNQIALGMSNGAVYVVEPSDM